jgi:hypothetical protein
MYLVFIINEKIVLIVNKLDLEWVIYQYFNKILSI